MPFRVMQLGIPLASDASLIVDCRIFRVIGYFHIPAFLLTRLHKVQVIDRGSVFPYLVDGLGLIVLFYSD